MVNNRNIIQMTNAPFIIRRSSLTPRHFPMNDKHNRQPPKRITIYHPRRIAKGELAYMLGFSRSDKIIPLFKKHFLTELDWTEAKYKKIQVFNMAQTKDVITQLVQKEFLTQQNIDEVCKDLRLHKNGQTTVTLKK